MSFAEGLNSHPPNRRLALRRPLVIAALSPWAFAPSLAAAQGEAPPTAPSPPAAPARVLTLAQVEHLALAQQPQMLVARTQTDVAQAGVEQARAPLLPQVTLSGQYSQQTGNFVARPGSLPSATSPAPSINLAKSYGFWNFGVTGTQLIYDFGQTWDKYRSASSTLEFQRLFERTTQLQLIANARRIYFNVRANKDLVGVARETLQDQETHLKQVAGFVTVGTQPPIALAQQKAAVATARVQLISAQNNYETSKAQLNQASGIVGDTDYDVGEEVLAPVDDEDQPLETLVAKAMANRPELAALGKQHEAEQAAVRSAKGAYGPSVAAQAGFTEVGSNLDGLVPNWNAGLLLTWPIFQGGLTNGQVHQAEATLAGVDAQQSLEVLQVRLDVNSAQLAVRAAKTTIDAAEDAVTSAREQLRLAEQRYATGVGSIIELNDAQVAYTTAAAQLVQARYQLASARAQLLAALGRT